MRKVLIICFIVVPVLFLGGILGTRWVLVEEHARYQSPDGHFQVVVYRQPMLSTTPGQGGDAPGTVVLVGPDRKVVRRQPIEMVQLASEPVWTKTRVTMKLQFDWELPQ